MDVRFVAHDTDMLAREALGMLGRNGYATQILTNGADAECGSVALFSSGGEFRRVNRSRYRFLRVASHRLETNGMDVPGWAKSTPFLVAIRDTTPIRTRQKEFLEALLQIAEQYSRWHPAQTLDAPWVPTWTHGRPDDFIQWRENAKKAVAGVSEDELLARHLEPVFSPAPALRRVLIVSCCAVFNRRHTDVADTLLPSKRDAAIRALSELIRDGKFSEVKFIIPGGDSLQQPALRAHLHQFMFESMGTVEAAIGETLGEQERLWGRRHSRTDEEIHQSLEAGRACVEREIVAPMRKLVATPVSYDTWRTCLGGYLARGQELAERHVEFVRDLYYTTVINGPASALLHRFNPARGFERTLGNAAMYFAQALYMMDRPDHLIANVEQTDIYWKAFEPVIAASVWGQYRPYIGMVDTRARQPWAF
jgi:hypothetical protein